MQTEIIAKATGTITNTTANVIDLETPSVVRLDLNRDQVASMVREGNDLVIRLNDGQTIRIDNFYVDQRGLGSDLVLRENNGGQWLAHPGTSGAGRFTTLTNLDDLLAAQAAQAGGSSFILPAILGVAGAGGLIAAVASGGNDGEAQIPTTPPDTQAPARPTAVFGSNGGVVTGTGEAGSTVRVIGGNGSVLGTGTVGTDGSYSVPLNPPQANGQQITVTQTDAAGNVSPATTINAPDITPPAVPTAAINGQGTTITGTGEPGATVTVRNAAGQVLGTATVDAQGNYTLTLTTAQANGGTLTVTQSDAAGNASPAASVAAPDLTPPTAPTATIDDEGTSISGTGEPGATVSVRDGAGVVLGSTTVDAQGNYTLALDTPQANGEALTVTQSDAAGNPSPATPLTAPDITPPAAPTATIGADGVTITGIGEPGTTLTIRDSAGTVLGTAVVDAQGGYTLTLATPQAEGTMLMATLTDAAGNVSPEATIIVSDLEAPTAPTATISADGTSVVGSGDPGATVSVRDPAGQVIGNALVGADGSYTLTLSPAQANGETLSVLQTNAQGLSSPTISLLAPDITAPATPVATLAGDGTVVTGTGEPGATVRVVGANGQTLGTATVGADGGFSVPLTPALTNGQTLTVDQVDAAGNASPDTTLTAGDTTAPAAPSAAIDAQGSTVTGTGEPGATVTVRDPAGQIVGTAVVDAQGNYTLPLTTPQTAGGSLTVTQSDAAGNASPATTVTAPDTTAPTAPVATVSTDGTTLTGTGEAGATVQVTNAGGQPIGTATVGADGSYTIALPTGTADGRPLTVTQTDTAGNVSPATSAATPDLVAPAAPTAALNADGTVLTGTGEPGATVQVSDANGQPLGTATVATDGTYSVTLPAGTADGQVLTVTQADAAGNVSPPTTATTTDTTAPGAPVATVSADGTTLTGTGEAGATVQVTNAGGQPIGTATVGADGSYTIALPTGTADGRPLTVTQADAAGNVSPATSAATPDLVAPTAPTAILGADGLTLSGTGEAGATVEIRAADGSLLGSATVAGDGSYSAKLTGPQANGETLTVTQTDAAGNASPTTSITAPDTTAPAAPVATVSADGATLTGTGEAGATVQVTDADGQPIGTATVAAEGSYSIALPAGIADGRPLTVTQTDATGNVSPATSATTPDLVAPTAPSLAVSADGTSVSGTGEAGATVEIRAADGSLLASTVVAADGSYSVTLATPQANGEALTATQTDAAGNISPAISVTAPDITAPAAPTATLAADGASVFGNGEPGATVRIVDANGTLLGTAVVDADTSFTLTLTPPQVNGQTLSATQADAAGNVSQPATVSAPDVTAPDAPIAAISVDGATVTGTGEPFATVTIRAADGTPIGTAVVAADGSFSAALTPAQANGETLSIDQTDRGGNSSPAATLTAPDITAPTGLVAAISGDGSIVTGTGEAGATVTVRDANGASLGTAVVAADGTYSVPLTTAQIDSEALTVVQADAAGNVSAPVPLTAPDLTAPLAPTGAVIDAGATLNGTGEAGATVTVRAADGTVLGAATVGADGSFAVPLTPLQANGETLQFTQTDAAGNVSPIVSIIAPDITAPTGLVAAISGDGSIVTGTGEAGATVTVRDANGASLGTAVVATNGIYSVQLTTPQVGSQSLTVVQADAAGNVSAPVPLTAPDLTAPLAPTGAVIDAGATLSGTGEAGATVTVRAADGTVLGSAVVAADGSFAVPLSPAQANGEILQFTQTDPAGNVSANVTVIAPDVTAPTGLTAGISGDGAMVTGTGEEGAIVTVRDTNGATLGTAVVDANGIYMVQLTPAQIDSEPLTVVQADAAGNVSAPVPLTAPDLTAPPAPTGLVIDAGATLTGTGEAGATVTVRAADGTVLGTAIVGADGSFTVPLATPQANGETLTLVQADVAGNVSPGTIIAAPDITAPIGLTATISADGSVMTGTGEPGAIVTIRDPAGTAIGTATVAVDGSYAAILTPAQLNGEILQVVQADATGNASAPVNPVAPDLTAPLAPLAALAAGGTSVTGIGEAGATVTVRAADGSVLGTATVAADGSFTVPLATAQINGETLSVEQSDAAGNVSPALGLTALDTSAPTAPTAIIDGTGTVVSGQAEAGAIVTVRDPAGTVIGTVTAGINGDYAVAINPPQANGETLTVTQSDVAGNLSAPTPVLAPDITAPNAPLFTINATGTEASGNGEAGATVTIRDPAGTVIGTTVVAADGTFTVPLAPAQANGGTLSAILTDAGGNDSPTSTAPAPDITAPTIPAASLDATGTIVSGTGEAGATVTVRAADGTILGTALVAANGTYAVVLSTPQLDSQVLSVSQADAIGNISPSTTVTALDQTPPGAPVAAVSVDGTTLTGTGEIGATVTVTDPVGIVLATVPVGADGSFTVTLTPPLTNGQLLTLTQADAAGNISVPGNAAAPDLIPNDTPGAPTAAVAVDGGSVSGTGLAGTTITVRDATGTVIGTTIVAGDGSYTALLTTPQLNGETVRVTQTDAEGDVSPPAIAIAPDLTPPAAPTATIDATGTVVSGLGEAGATLTVTGVGGTVLGTTTVLANGSYAVVLNTAQTNGEPLTVIQADGAGNASPSAAVTAPDLTAPLAPAGIVSADGTTLTGTGEAGATVTISDAAGNAIGTALVAADGSFTATLTPAQANGELLTLTQADAAGNVSPIAQALAPDITAPVGLTAAINGAGTLVTGTGEAGAIVTIRDDVGTVLGTAIVAANGTYAALLTPAQINGELLSAIQVDSAGNAGTPAPVTAPDLTAPLAPAGTVSVDGTTLTGTGEAGATVTIRAVDGTVLGTALVAADGSFTAALTPAQANGEVLTLTQADAAGNVSPIAQAIAPDFTLPVGLTAAINGAGTLVTGTGEAGATVTIRDAGGTVLGTAVVAANGTYAAVLTTPQIAGQALTATQADPAGNVGAPAPITAPDLTAPLAPAGTVSADGTTITGTGEAGATVTIRAVDGTILGTAVVAGDGSFTAALNPAQANGELLSLTQADAAGNVSPIGQATAPDITVPVGLTAAINGAGTLITGTGEAGATVTIRDAAGIVLGTAVVAANGTYAAALTTPQINGQALTATQADAAGNVGAPAPITAPDLLAPLAPIGTISADGTTLIGTGEPGATVTIRSAGGAVLGTAVVAADGSFTAALSPVQANGQIVSLTQADASGNVSGVAQATAPDITAPIGLTAAINGAGTLVTGSGEAGATVTIRDAGGAILGTAVVAANGTYAAVLTTPQINGQALIATQADAAGNVGASAPITAPDLVAPLAPIGTISADGTTLIGTGEPGATVTIRSAGGTVLGTAVVAADGSFAAPLSPAQANGQIVSLTQADASGNVSGEAQATAPDITAPVGLTAAINGAGTLIAGTGEAGATVIIRDAGGAILGTTVVAANGTYSAVLTTPQLNSQTLTVTQADAAGNVSAPATVVAPDLTAPLAPVGIVAANGTAISGTGEAGATVTIRAVDGTVLGTALVAANGTFTAPLSPAQANGQIVSLTQADAAGNVSPIGQATAPDITAPIGLTSTINGIGTIVTGTGEAGATVTVRDPLGNVIGTAIVGANGSYSAALTTPQANGQLLQVTQADAAGNASLPNAVRAPDITPPAAPIGVVNGTGTVVTGTGEAGATVRIFDPLGQLVGTAVVAGNGSFSATLTIPQANGQVLTLSQTDAAGNASGTVAVNAPDITPPAAPTAVIDPTGSVITGSGEPGARIEVRNAAGTLIGTGTVTAGGLYAVTLTSPQVAGQALGVGARDAAGNLSASTAVTAPFDISAFDNTAIALVDLNPVQTNQNVGTANYTALVSLGAVNLDAQVLAVPNVQFTVQPGHTLATTFTYDATVNVGVASGYSVVIQRFNGTNWVAVNGGGNSSLLQVGLLNGDLVATANLAPGQYRAFVTFDNTAGVGLLGSLNVRGVDSDFTDVASAVPAPVSGNVITDAGPTGQIDVVSPQTRVESVTLNGVTTQVAVDDTVVTGQWGTLIIDRDGSYTYTPNANAASIGKVDSFTYTLLDASDNERESARLTISIGSPDITGAPIAVNDTAIAAASFTPVVVNRAAAVDTFFSTPAVPLLGAPQTTRVNDSFTVDANSTSTVTLSAVTASTLSVLPSYTVTVTNSAGAVVGTASGTAVAGVGGLVGSGISVTMSNLPSGTYNYTVVGTNGAPLRLDTNVYVAETVTRLNEFNLTGTTPVSGQLTANDTLGSPFIGIKVLTGTGFQEIGDTPITLNGAHGQLTINETGGYTYTPVGVTYAATDPIDSFTYQLIQPDGQFSTARLDVAVNINNGVAPVFPTATITALSADSALHLDADVVPMTLSADHMAPADTPATDQADARLALSLMEGQGSIEDVLGHYLDAHQTTADVTTANDNVGVTATVTDINSTVPIMDDPLAYLTVSVDPEQEKMSTMHIM
ncbi:BapA prefix-like domain-containing protein [Sphingomonas paucimobilis]|uniref:BapA/Bap/LapF family large adhesin n=1 Tax=Sphingomonas paucimobilis TaxID=13689 RepID=UPI0019646D52|nr:BapA/Bap/LapF family large adhesin [Sphingomonas paucimobilis]QRY96341.1 BapA prefix-like domain-containing protein [Sphingomonas paucimobilis]